MYLQPHRELHIAVPPPPKPTPQLMYGAMEMLEDLPEAVRLDDPVKTIGMLSEHFSEQRGKLAHRIGANLAEQLVFIEAGHAC